MTALKTGADLAYVGCSTAAVLPLKCLSPELIVLDVLGGRGENLSLASAASALALSRFLPIGQPPRLDAAIIGPGLGRDEQAWQLAADAAAALRDAGVPTVFDGDALALLCSRPHLLARHPAAVLTPNPRELEALWRAMNAFAGTADVPRVPDDAALTVERLLSLLEAASGGGAANIALLVKGPVDTLSALFSDSYADGTEAVLAADGSVGVAARGVPTLLSSIVAEEGSPRRCGGQGDVLAGAVGTFLAWAGRAGLFRGSGDARGAVKALAPQHCVQ